MLRSAIENHSAVAEVKRGRTEIRLPHYLFLYMSMSTIYMKF